MGMVWGECGIPFSVSRFHEFRHPDTRTRTRTHTHSHSILLTETEAFAFDFTERPKVCHANVAQACLERFCPPSRCLLFSSSLSGCVVVFRLCAVGRT